MNLKKIFLRFLFIVLCLYIVLCGGFYFFQEKLIFIPDKLNNDNTYNFNRNFEEIYIDTKDKIKLNGLLFKAENPKGLIFYLHGNAGALNSWGNIAPFYTDDLGYDIFILDYRGYGKSGGTIDNQQQLFSDVQTAYDKIKESYNENCIIVLGYSIGTCPATWLASENNPKMLILQAPYYSLTNIIQNICPIIPDFLVRYKLETYKYIPNCPMPVIIFHGNEDKLIDYDNSLQLKKLLKPTDRLITLDKEGHNGITNNEQYKRELLDILF
jgi:pimeloyl-ACP methyl ester carboxylesterase